MPSKKVRFLKSDSLRQDSTKEQAEEEGKQISSMKEGESISRESTPEKEQKILPFSYFKSYCRTQFELITVQYTWTIEQFQHLFRNVNVLQSPHFPETRNYAIQMNITRNPDLSIRTMEIYIRTQQTFAGSFTIDIIQTPETKLSERTFLNYILDMTLLRSIEISECIHLDTLELQCTFVILSKVLNNSIHMNLLSSATVFEDLKSLEDITSEIKSNDQNKSIKFIIEEEKYSISKELLYATKSSYFKNICDKHDGKEINMTSELTTNNELHIFKQILIFLLTGSLNECDDYNTFKDLFKKNDKYDIPALKTVCEHYLLRYITNENAVELLLFAILYNAKFLEQHLARFIKFRKSEIMNNEKFRNLPQHDINQINKIIEETDEIPYEVYTHFELQQPERLEHQKMPDEVII